MECEQLTASINLNQDIRALHRLAWRPGETMDPSWWVRLGLESWRAQYENHAPLRKSIDAIIVARDGFPEGPLRTSLNPQQRALMALGSRIVVVLTGLGLLALNTADYLLVRRYRTRLVALLGEQVCTRVLAAIPFSDARVTVSVDQIENVALRAGVVTLDSELPECPVWRTLRRTLPSYEAHPIDIPLRRFGEGQRSGLNFALRLDAICTQKV
jgi:hypothetical protein